MVYFDLLPQLEEYSAEEIGQLFLAMLEFGAFGAVPAFDDRGMRIIWREIQGKIERDNGKYQQRILDGAYGAYKREAQRNQQEAMSKDEWTKQIWIPAQDAHDVSSCQHKYTSEHMVCRNQLEQGTTTRNKEQGTTTRNKEQGTTTKLSRELRSRFSPPTLEDVAAYCAERGSKVDPQRWYDFYLSNGWKVGKNPMRDWKAAVRSWERNSIGAKSRGPNGIELADNEDHTLDGIL